jgi:hypothetical protein
MDTWKKEMTGTTWKEDSSLWDVILCHQANSSQCFNGPQAFHLHGDIKAYQCFKPSGIAHPMELHHIPEDSNLQQHCCENHKSHKNANLVYVNNCPTSCNNIQFMYICKLLYIFRVVTPLIITSSYHCICIIWHYWDRTATCLEREGMGTVFRSSHFQGR